MGPPQLPLELITHCISYLAHEDRIAAGRTCVAIYTALRCSNCKKLTCIARDARQCEWYEMRREEQDNRDMSEHHYLGIPDDDHDWYWYDPVDD